MLNYTISVLEALTLLSTEFVHSAKVYKPRHPLGANLWVFFKHASTCSNTVTMSKQNRMMCTVKVLQLLNLSFWLAVCFRRRELFGNSGAIVDSVSQRARIMWSQAIRGSNPKNLNWCQNKPIHNFLYGLQTLGFTC